LRGVDVPGLDEITDPAAQVRSQLALDDEAVDVLTGLWTINLVRVPFQAATMLAATPDLLAGLDDLVTTLADAGCYVLLALQPPPTADPTSLPDQDVFTCWASLADHYQDEPAALFELYAATGRIGVGWEDAAEVLIGSIRRIHPASLLFVRAAAGGDSLNGLPLLYATGQPAPNIVYTIGAPATAGVYPLDRLSSFAHRFPLFISTWADVDDPLGRLAETTGRLASSLGLGFAASSWTEDPRLVLDVDNHRYTPTRFGNAVLRALALPTPLQTFPFPTV
jgi:Cellulase (glycosyl hydrolase family 5)